VIIFWDMAVSEADTIEVWAIQPILIGVPVAACAVA
jgi:hypothetical protein